MNDGRGGNNKRSRGPEDVGGSGTPMKEMKIEVLEIKQSNGHLLDEQQIAKLQAKPFLEGSLAELGVLVETQENASSPMLLDGKGKKIDVPRKQRRKSKQKLAQVEATSGSIGTGIEPVSVKGFSSVEIFQTPNHKRTVSLEMRERASARERNIRERNIRERICAGEIYLGENVSGRECERDIPN
ncbi:hypothetical protein NE237_016290 [Protea cynaroides]|uniref:Uncharacterized protein n=1 Tax=Protea cynaroides TaxID=273540 RepID=A0A9Q0GM41_9MAGN|nr:hypothetical protein NE237_016290 [Protea cynaroides]